MVRLLLGFCRFCFFFFFFNDTATTEIYTLSLHDALSIRRKRTTGESRLWHRWATIVMRRPWVFLAGALIIVLALAQPALHLNLGSSGPDILPAGSEPRVATQIAARAFGAGQVAPAEIVLTD